MSSAPEMKPTECDAISDNSEEEVMIHRSPKLAHSITSIDTNYMIHNDDSDDDDDSDDEDEDDDNGTRNDEHDGSEDHGNVNRISRDEFCRRTFILARDEQVIQDFGCTYFSKLHIKGRLYVTTRHLCFYSNILGYITSFAIALSDVTDIAKRNSAVVLPNAIEVFTRQNSHFFSNFAQRSVTYSVMQQAWMVEMNRRFERDVGIQFNSLGGSIVKRLSPSKSPKDSIQRLASLPVVDHEHCTSPLRERSNSFPIPRLTFSSSPTLSPSKSTQSDYHRGRTKSNVDQAPSSSLLNGTRRMQDSSSSASSSASLVETDRETNGRHTPSSEGTITAAEEEFVLADENLLITEQMDDSPHSQDNGSPVTAAIKRAETAARGDLSSTVHLKMKIEDSPEIEDIDSDVQVLDIFPVPPEIEMKKIMREWFPISANEFFSLFYGNDSDFIHEIHSTLGDSDVEVDKWINFRPGVPFVRGIKYRISGKKSVLGSALSGSKSAVVLETQRLIMTHNITHTMTYLVIHSTLLPHDLSLDQSFQVEYKMYVTDTRPKGDGEAHCKLDIYVGVASKSKASKSHRSSLVISVTKAVSQQMEIIVRHMHDQCNEYVQMKYDNAKNNGSDDDDDSHEQEQRIEKKLQNIVANSISIATSSVESETDRLSHTIGEERERSNSITFGKGMKRSYTEEELSAKSFELKELSGDPSELLVKMAVTEKEEVTMPSKSAQPGTDSTAMTTTTEVQDNCQPTPSTAALNTDTHSPKLDTKESISEMSVPSSVTWMSILLDISANAFDILWQFKRALVMIIVFFLFIYFWYVNMRIAQTLVDLEHRVVERNENLSALSDFTLEIARDLTAVDVTALDNVTDQELGDRIRRKVTLFLLERGQIENVSAEDLIDIVFNPS